MKILSTEWLLDPSGFRLYGDVPLKRLIRLRLRGGIPVPMNA